jgi:hypothetical protein
MSDLSNLLKPATISQIETYLDREENQKRFSDQGQLLYRVFGTERGRDISSQVRNLQQATTSATRLSDVEDFIKNQMGKGTGAARQWRRDGLGQALLDELGRLRVVARDLAETNPQHEIQVRLRLARGWVRAVVSEYLYCRAQAEVAQGG